MPPLAADFILAGMFLLAAGLSLLLFGRGKCP
jgi:hypothetical protein